MLLGFDIGGTKCAVILGKQNGGPSMDIVDKEMVPTDRPAYEMIEYLFGTGESLLQKNGLSPKDITGLGISCGGPLSSRKGLILSPPNLPGWDNIPIVQLAENRFGRQALLQNDANACAMAEWKFGAGRGCDNLIFLTFGTGMGAGLILDGRLYAGANDFAGEVGHLRLAEMGPVGFGKAGSFEGYCSGGGIAQLAQIMVREQLQMGRSVSFCERMEDLPQLSAKLVAEFAYKGDALAIDIYKTCGEFLGRGLSVLIDVVNPELSILGSIYGRAKELLEPHMNATIEREALSHSRAVCRIAPAQLGENIGDIAALSLAAAVSPVAANVN